MAGIERKGQQLGSIRVEEEPKPKKSTKAAKAETTEPTEPQPEAEG